MNKAFEKISERLEEKENEAILKAPNTYDSNNPEYQKWMMKSFGFKESMKIVQEVAEEYNGGWIPCSERLPEEKLCEDGKYDPSEKVLIQLDNEEMFTSRYWSHRHFKDSDDFEKWIDLPDYYQDRVLAWQPLPEPYEEH